MILKSFDQTCDVMFSATSSSSLIRVLWRWNSGQLISTTSSLSGTLQQHESNRSVRRPRSHRHMKHVLSARGHKDHRNALLNIYYAFKLNIVSHTSELIRVIHTRYKKASLFIIRSSTCTLVWLLHTETTKGCRRLEFLAIVPILRINPSPKKKHTPPALCQFLVFGCLLCR